MVKSYTTRKVEKKLLGNAMKASKTTTTKRIRIKKTTVVEDENVEVGDVVEEGNIDTDVVSAIAKRRKEAQEGRKTRSLEAKPKTFIPKKHIAV